MTSARSFSTSCGSHNSLTSAKTTEQYNNSILTDRIWLPWAATDLCADFNWTCSCLGDEIYNRRAADPHDVIGDIAIVRALLGEDEKQAARNMPPPRATLQYYYYFLPTSTKPRA